MTDTPASGPESACCDVCDGDGATIVTAGLRMLDGPATTTIRFCRPCTEALFAFLDDRRARAIRDGNATVAQVLDVAGLPPAAQS